MKHRMIPQGVLLLLLALGVSLPGAGLDAQAGGRPTTGKPQLNLRANPVFGFPPLRTVFTAELIGGADDYEDFYCTKVEWEWGDGTTSAFGYDCDPYEAGKSEIRRRFTAEHTYRTSGRTEAVFRLKQGSKVVGAARIVIQINAPAAAVPESPAPWSPSRP